MYDGNTNGFTEWGLLTYEGALERILDLNELVQDLSEENSRLVSLVESLRQLSEAHLRLAEVTQTVYEDYHREYR